jgi:hypothetical protein
MANAAAEMKAKADGRRGLVIRANHLPDAKGLI